MTTQQPSTAVDGGAVIDRLANELTQATKKRVVAEAMAAQLREEFTSLADENERLRSQLEAARGERTPLGLPAPDESAAPAAAQE